MDNLQSKYNRYLILVLALGPISGFLVVRFLKLDFYSLMQMFSFIGVIFILLFRKNNQKVIFPRYLLFYLLFILYVFYSDLIMLNRPFKANYLIHNYFIGGFNFMFIIENIKINKKLFLFIIRISKLLILFAVVVIVIQQIIDPNFLINPAFLENMFYGESANQTRLRSIYSYMTSMSFGLDFVPVFLFVVEYLDRRNDKVLIWIVCGLLYTLLTKARWIMLNSLFVFPQLIIGYKDKSKRMFKYLIVLPFFLVVLSGASSLVGIDINGIVEERILESNKKNLNEKSASSRLLAFELFNKFFWDKPFFGAGNYKYGMGGSGKNEYKLRRALNKRSSQLHVGYLSLLYWYGIFGGFLFLSFLYLLLKMLFHDAKKTNMWAPFFAFLGFALANVTLVYFSLFHAGLILALYANKYYLDEKAKINVKNA